MDLHDMARAWLDQDPDPATRSELQRLIETNDAELADCFAGRLHFGTAGLRGPLGPGPNRMNRVVVLQSAAGLARYLTEHFGPECSIVIGYDARHNSDVFAHDTASIMQGAGVRAFVLPRPLPTPVLAFAIRHLGASAGVMVTASHNPPQDNGYKVYLEDGCQIVPPVDGQIAAMIDSVASSMRVDELPRNDGWQTLDESIVHSYAERALEILGPDEVDRRADVVSVITPMHGVGGRLLEQLLTDAGFAPCVRVDAQFDPDPDFSTVAFPNPEEPGAMDLALATAERVRPDVIVANDPDADRCAIGVPTPGGDYRMLSGDEVGYALGWWASRRDSSRSTLAQSLVSGGMLKAIADSSTLNYQQTLTGFKWIGRIPTLRFGYEEALGYCVDPETVRDKDGITAALAVADLIAELKADSRSILDLLDDLAREHGLYATRQVSLRVADLSTIRDIMESLRSQPPTTVGKRAVETIVDLQRGTDLPPTDGLVLTLAGQGRIIVRPSGTEPKIKAYLQVVVEVGSSIEDARETAERQLDDLANDVGQWFSRE
ncbi:MAG: phospho-sugar mutase [Candidatus Nanopelagicales bacterium]